MNTPYPNLWHVRKYSDHFGWMPLLASYGNRSYATGFFNAVRDTGRYRLITNKGELFEESQEPSMLHENSIAPATGGAK